MINRVSLGALIVALVAGGCAELTEPGPSAGAAAAPAATTAVATAAPTPAPNNPPPARTAQPRGEEIAASHILIGFKGATRAKSDRDKEDARKMAEQVLARAKAGQDFAELAKKHSEGPSAPRGGALGRFQRNAMVKPFADAAFALKPGDVSGVVETNFGFHIIKRTE
jgi:hypothetical protein